jgi:hypothetical protein
MCVPQTGEPFFEIVPPRTTWTAPPKPPGMP